MYVQLILFFAFVIAKQEQTKLFKSMLDKEYADLKSFPPLCLPVCPDIYVDGLIVDECKVFGSAQAPIRLMFKVANSMSKYGVSSITTHHSHCLRHQSVLIIFMKRAHTSAGNFQSRR